MLVITVCKGVLLSFDHVHAYQKHQATPDQKLCTGVTASDILGGGWG